MRVPPRTSVALGLQSFELIAAPECFEAASRKIAELCEALAVERARRVTLLGSIADTLERLTEEVRQMAREA